jgi:hypothetical protein
LESIFGGDRVGDISLVGLEAGGNLDVPQLPLELSPPAPGTNWADWSNALGREMYLHRALAKLNAEYPPEADCDFLTHRALEADGSDSY